MTSESIDPGEPEIPQLPTNPLLVQGGGDGVNVAQLIHDLMHLPAGDAHAHFSQAGVHFEHLEWEKLPWYDSSMVSNWNIGADEALDGIHIYDLLRLLENHMGFFHELSPHTWNSQNRVEQYYKYINHLRRMAVILSAHSQKQIWAFAYKDTTTRGSMLQTLSNARLSPDQVSQEILAMDTIDPKNNVSHRTMFAYSGIGVYEKLFHSFLTAGMTLLNSQKPEITSRELLSYTRSVLSRALKFLRTYLYAPEVSQFIKWEYGDNILWSIFDELEVLEIAYSQRIGTLEWSLLKSTDYVLFYQGYRALVRRIFDLEVIPQKISLVRMKEVSKKE